MCNGEASLNSVKTIYLLMKWPKDEHISHKDGCRNAPQKGSSMQYPAFCGQDLQLDILPDFLDIQNRVSYTASHKKEVLIN